MTTNIMGALQLILFAFYFVFIVERQHQERLIETMISYKIMQGAQYQNISERGTPLWFSLTPQEFGHPSQPAGGKGR